MTLVSQRQSHLALIGQLSYSGSLSNKGSARQYGVSYCMIEAVMICILRKLNVRRSIEKFFKVYRSSMLVIILMLVTCLALFIGEQEMKSYGLGVSALDSKSIGNQPKVLAAFRNMTIEFIRAQNTQIASYGSSASTDENIEKRPIDMQLRLCEFPVESHLFFLHQVINV